MKAASLIARRARPSAHLMMSSPRHFEVSYAINPWMDPSQWSVSADRLADDARRGWAQLKATYERLGARVTTQDPVRGLPDLVFTANAAVVLDRKVLLARFLCAERRGEEPHNRRFFEALRDRGLVDEVVDPPPGLYFEGAGDAIWDASRGLIWTGYGQRSSRGVHAAIESLYGVPTVPLELVDPRFYHLDTCFCVLSGGEVLWYPSAFSAESADAVRRVAGAGNLIEATDEDALHLGVNSVCLGRDVVMCHASDATRAVPRRTRLPGARRSPRFVQSVGRRRLLPDAAPRQRNPRRGPRQRHRPGAGIRGTAPRGLRPGTPRNRRSG